MFAFDLLSGCVPIPPKMNAISIWPGHFNCKSSTVTPMRAYCDTNTLFHNIRGEDAIKVEREVVALEKLLELRRRGKLLMFRSRVTLTEINATEEWDQRGKLLSDYETLDQLPLDEKVIGFENLMDGFGGPTNPFVSDVQDETLCTEINSQLCSHLGRGNEHDIRQRYRDAQHITQAVANQCNVFLTRDYRTIIQPLREYLQSRFKGFSVKLPSELVMQIDQGNPE